MSKVGLPGVDNFGNESNQRRSPHLSTVMQGRPRASTCKLLQLPAEILAAIADLLRDAKKSLRSLALVNSDCQQLARRRQLAAINFKHSAQEKRRASALADDKSSQVLKPGVSACVRRVTFAQDRRTICRHHGQLAWALSREYSESLTDEHRHALSDDAFRDQAFRDVREAVVEAISSMPNLETLIWKDEDSLDKSLFEKIARCSARHIELNGQLIDDEWYLTPLLTPSTWPLRSLKLDVGLVQYGWSESKLKGEVRMHAITRFFSTLFHLCSSTLESLTWSDSEDIKDDDVLVSIGETAVAFPRLKYLRLQCINLDSVAISSFLGAPLKSLELDETVLTNPSISNCEPLRDLEESAVSHPPTNMPACRRVAKFISRHTGLHKLYLRESQGGNKYLNDIILPTLNSLDFGNLRSLHLECGTNIIPDKSLQMIARLVSLEQLSLSAGRPSELQYYWEVDHDKLRHHLSPLQRLTKLALFHDTYPSFEGVLPSGLYYLCRISPKSAEEANARPELDREEIDIQMEPMTRRERMHRNRMLDQAEEYANIFPKLEWMFCGQRLMGFVRTLKGQNGLPKAVPLTKEKDQHSTYPEAIFQRL
ncbi:hypothetical protein FPCIR_6012 [Fusarium pseudocircinatum]|uniref:Uncharacterized protein n=1 Tax=Fusarium pseudocircinatum TaxID=56676 RepID=A0A8H5P7W4_9HYPO|nr:hypothetical protein FPCIR_6012 [Fusarium pseudocircinatum]